jgi:toxin YhaV
VVVAGWTILAHPLFLDAIERLVGLVESEQAAKPDAPPSGNAKLLGHLLDLALVKIPQDPGNAAYRHGGSLADRRHWFRGKTGGGRYRLFYRYDSRAKIIIYAWVNDDNSLRTYGSGTDAYAVFAKMLDSGNPPDTWDDLMEAAGAEAALRRLGQFAAEVGRRKG